MPPATRASPDARTASRQSVAGTLSRIAAMGRSAERGGRACSVDADVRVTSRIQGASSARASTCRELSTMAGSVTATDNPSHCHCEGAPKQFPSAKEIAAPPGRRNGRRGLQFSREIGRNQPLQFCRRLLFVGSVGRNLDLLVLLHSQRQHPDDALSVHPWTVAGGVTHPDL